MNLNDIIDRLNADERSYRAIARAASIDHKQLTKFADRRGVIGGDKLVRLLGVLGLVIVEIDSTGSR